MSIIYLTSKWIADTGSRLNVINRLESGKTAGIGEGLEDGVWQRQIAWNRQLTKSWKSNWSSCNCDERFLAELTAFCAVQRLHRLTYLYGKQCCVCYIYAYFNCCFTIVYFDCKKIVICKVTAKTFRPSGGVGLVAE